MGRALQPLLCQFVNWHEASKISESLFVLLVPDIKQFLEINVDKQTVSDPHLELSFLFGVHHRLNVNAELVRM